MSDFRFLSDAELIELEEALFSAANERGHFETPLRCSEFSEALLIGIDLGFLSNTTFAGSTPIERLRSTMRIFNTVGQLYDGSVPFEIWLGNANVLSRGTPGNTTIQAMFARVTSERQPSNPVNRPPGDSPRLLLGSDQIAYIFTAMRKIGLAHDMDTIRGLTRRIDPAYVRSMVTLSHGKTISDDHTLMVLLDQLNRTPVHTDGSCPLLTLLQDAAAAGAGHPDADRINAGLITVQSVLAERARARRRGALRNADGAPAIDVPVGNENRPTEMPRPR